MNWLKILRQSHEEVRVKSRNKSTLWVDGQIEVRPFLVWMPFSIIFYIRRLDLNLCRALWRRDEMVRMGKWRRWRWRWWEFRKESLISTSKQPPSAPAFRFQTVPNLGKSLFKLILKSIFRLKNIRWNLKNTFKN